MNDSQLPLEFRDLWRDEDSAGRVLKEARAVAEEAGVKALASDLDMAHSELSKKLDEKDRNFLKPRELLGIMRRDHPGRVLRALAAELGYDIVKRRELSAGEKLDKLTTEIERNPALARLLYEAAFGPGGRP